MAKPTAAGMFRTIRKSALRALALAALGAPLAQANEPAVAPVPIQGEETDTQKLEQAFWACDYVATTEGIQATPVGVCRYVTEELKQQKFGGNFSQFLEWWKAHKPAEHRRMARLKDQ